jgi:hypothetical protein
LIVKAPAKKEKQSLYKYAWIRESDGVFGLIVNDNTFFIGEENGTWTAIALINNKRHRAVRSTLEEAFKASDRLLYKNFPKEWTMTDASAIMASWREDLNL